MAVAIADAARNNAAWCDAICSTHGGPGRFFDSYWLTRAPAPRLYPNLVTLDPALEPVLAALRELDESRPSASWAVKDSFGVLPLAQAGFRLLFEADWIVRPAPAARSRPSSRWLRVASEPALAAWEAAWGQGLGQPRVFLPALLQRSEIAILARLDDAGAITAGGFANRTESAVGLSNFFAHGDQKAPREEWVETAAQTFPGLPLVGYEAGKDLAEAFALGFSSLGSLRVWER